MSNSPEKTRATSKRVKKKALAKRKSQAHNLPDLSTPLERYPFSSPDEYLSMAEHYFHSTRKATMSGLALALGFNSRAAFNKFPTTTAGKVYAGVHARTRLMIENAYEMQLYSNGAGGAIFALKNMGWTDRQVLSAEVVVTKIKRQIVKPNA